MKHAATIRRHHSAGQRGYAILLVVFLAAVMLVAATGASMSVVTDGKREKEKEMIWRGKQYVRGVKLFYRKNGRFPAEVDDLSKAKTGSLRFLRQAYKDPMNKADGTWRLIYVGPSGQLIGSLKPHPLLQLPTPATPGGTAGAPAGGTPAPATTGATGAATGSGQPGATGAPGSATAPAGGTQGSDSSGSQPGQNATGTPDLPPGNVDSPTVFGGKIIGVGSKIDGRSLIIYDKAKNYRLFEFYWDPSKDAPRVGQPPASIGTQPGNPIGTPIGGGPFGGQPQGQSPILPGTQ